MWIRPLVVALVAVSLLAGCGNGDDGSGRSANEVAEILAEVADGETVEIDEDNDPNDLLGRPNGYEAAAVVKDPRLDEPCIDLGVECGVTVEQWASAGDAEDRSVYILTILEDAPMLGSEYHYLDGAILVRVTGELPPSAAKEYETALND